MKYITEKKYFNFLKRKSKPLSGLKVGDVLKVPYNFHSPYSSDSSDLSVLDIDWLVVVSIQKTSYLFYSFLLKKLHKDDMSYIDAKLKHGVFKFNIKEFYSQIGNRKTIIKLGIKMKKIEFFPNIKKVLNLWRKEIPLDDMIEKYQIEKETDKYNI